VTAVNGELYVASERDNTTTPFAKISVLEVDPTKVVAQNGDTDGDLNATHEWRPRSDLGPNPARKLRDRPRPEPARRRQPRHRGGRVRARLVSDLVSVFKDEHTGAVYNPANYPLPRPRWRIFRRPAKRPASSTPTCSTGDNTFTRIATISTGFQTIQDCSVDSVAETRSGHLRQRLPVPQFDHQGLYECGRERRHFPGRDGVTHVDRRGREPEQRGLTPSLPISECVNGSRAAYWSDDTMTTRTGCAPRRSTARPTRRNRAIVHHRDPAQERERLEQHQRGTSRSPAPMRGRGSTRPTATLNSQLLTASGTASATCIDKRRHTPRPRATPCRSTRSARR